MTNEEKRNIYNNIQNLYNMDFTTWQEVLAMMYNLVADIEQKFEAFEQKFEIMVGKEVTEAIKKLYESGKLAEIINQEVFGDLNNKIDKIEAEILMTLTDEIGRVDKEIEVINEQLDNIINYNSKINYYITPELFGAKGDGINDDTEAIKQAFSMSMKGIFLKSSKEKIYLISENLDYKGMLNVDFGGATLKCNSLTNLSTFIRLGLNEDNIEDEYGGQIVNLKIDGNNKCNLGLDLCFGRKSIYNNLEVKNCIEKGIRTGDNHEVTISDINIQDCPIGLVVDGSDSHFINIYTRYCKIGIDAINGHNIFENCHGWLKDSTMFDGSVFMRISSPQTLRSIYPDTYQTGFYFIKNASSTFTDIRFQYANSVVNGSKCYLFKFDDKNYSNGVKVISMYVSTSGADVDFSNLERENCGIKIVDDGCNIFNVNKVPKGLIPTLAETPEAVVINANNISKKNNRVNIDLQITINTTINTTGLLIGTLPSNFAPNTNKLFPIIYGDTEYTADNIAYASITTGGGIRIKRLNGLTDISSSKMFFINVTYDIEYLYN